ncbi:MAG: hypothetical protein AAF928_01650 [Myxococcota bacterium]
MKNVSLGASLAAGVAMTFAGALVGCSKPTPAPEAADGAPGTMAKVECKEANSCKGNGSCAGVAMGEKHDCKGQNTCGGNVRTISKEECDEIGGSVLASN